MCWKPETMKKQAQEISSGVYTYRHRCEGGVDIHDVFVKKSTFRVLLLCVGAIFILANVFHALLSKESLCLGSFWSISFAVIFVKCLRYKPVKKESLVIMPAFGVQLEEHFWRVRRHRRPPRWSRTRLLGPSSLHSSGRVHRQFVPIGKILKPVLNECVTPVTCYWSLALLLRDEDELMLVFKKLHPPVKMLVPIWKALCALTNSDSMSPSVVPPSNDLHKHVEQDWCCVVQRKTWFTEDFSDNRLLSFLTNEKWLKLNYKVREC